MKDLNYLIALHSVPGVGSVRLKRLVDVFGGPKAAWEAKVSDLKKAGLGEIASKKLDEVRKTLDPDKYFEEVENLGIKILTIWDEDYPKLLAEIYDPPTIIYYKGNKDLFNKKAIGIVGSRKVTGYGRMVTENLTSDLVKSGLVIVSGLARGVDSIAHQATIKEEGATIAVLAGGIDEIYPPENTDLAHQILESGGLILSEFPPHWPHLAGNFPQRNRIISGLSLGVLVTEAAEDSGSLITARQALDQNRAVFAVPGPINSQLSQGPSELIKNGAVLVTNYKDILDELGLDLHQKPQSIKDVQLEDSEKEIIGLLNNETKHLDEICRSLNRKTSEISANLVKMEIKGLVKNLGGGIYTALV